jgi:gamma-glutamylcyclotransferase (GGCT)/AIG2-like uncharacterized protein YtfP
MTQIGNFDQMESALFDDIKDTASINASPGFRPIFTYGSLMYKPVCQRVLKTTDSPLTQKAILQGYNRFKVPDMPYPGIKPAAPHSNVVGLILYLADESYYDLLDLYEGNEYERRTVKVSVVEGGVETEDVECDVYVFVGEMGKDEWSFEEFVREFERGK